jgi:thioredoxin 1
MGSSFQSARKPEVEHINQPHCTCALARINFVYAIHRGCGRRDRLGFCHNAATLAVSETPKGKPMASDLIKHVTDASFEADVLQATQPTLVDYWAEWCGPCKMIAPILDEVSASYAGKLQIAKMNVDENRDIPAKFGIRGIPTLMLFKDGQLAATKVGAMSKAQLTAFIDQQLA